MRGGSAALSRGFDWRGGAAAQAANTTALENVDPLATDDPWARWKLSGAYEASELEEDDIASLACVWRSQYTTAVQYDLRTLTACWLIVARLIL